jgi:alkylation response protein AidB-like acyl-CoA dehydrogenase
MDLNFTADEQAFRADIRDWVAKNLPKEISHKVHNALRLSRDDLQRWARILGAKGWLGWSWPKQFGGPGWNAVQRHLFEEECALAGAPRVIPFGPVMVAPVIMAFGTPEQQRRHLPGIMSGEVWFDDVEVPAENLVGEENKGWTYAKYLLAHERTNIADVNRAKRELERLKRIAKSEGVYDDRRFRDEIARLEVEVVALEMMVLRVLSAEKSGKQSLDVAGLLKIRGSEIQQRYSELMMLAAGPAAVPYVREAMEAGWQGDLAGGAIVAPLASTYFNMRKTTIYGGSNEVQRNIVSQTVLG